MGGLITLMVIGVLLIPLGMLVAIVILWGRVDSLETRLRQFEDAPPATAPGPIAAPPPPPTMAETRTMPARVVRREPVDDDEAEHALAHIVTRAQQTTPSEPPPPEPPPAEPAPAQAFAGFENLVGGRLPVWIGGAALVLAGFFLVRYSIEAGLLGPGVRVILAAIFAVLLVAASEVARRSRHTADDPRIAQALAGAGIATAYGTLYMAGELYGLIGGGAAFALMLAVTAAALGLSLRHGPPTAVMGLIGGFAAPLVTGYDESNLVPLLAYLALFTAALFGLAIARGWAWLAIAAAGTGFAWSLGLIAAVDGPAAAAIGPFILVLAIGASLTAPRAPDLPAGIRIAPLLIGLLQLLLLAPRLDFGPLAWALYGLLALAAIVLAARDARLLPAALAGVGLALALLAMGLAEDGATAPTAALAYALLFAGAGHALAMRRPTERIWDVIALVASAGPWLLAWSLRNDLLSDIGWALIVVPAVASAALVAWRTRDPVARLIAPLVAAALAIAGLADAIGWQWLPLTAALTMAALGGWARRLDDDRAFLLPVAGWLAALALALLPIAAYASVLLVSLSGERLPYRELPTLADGIRALLLPAALAGALLAWDQRQFGRLRPFVLATACVAGGAILYHFAKLPLAIDTPDRFVALGFTERALLTQALFAAAFVLARREGWALIARGLALLALGRIVAFDLILLNPLFVEQSVGAIPLLNAAVLHAAASAVWLWLLSRSLPPQMIWHRLSWIATLLAALALVRQATHGAILTGDFGQGETWLYSAAMLAVAIGWLARGIRTGARDLRLAGLGLMTLTTLKVFLIDAAALDGLLRILSFLGLGIALIAIGWAYNKVLRAPAS